jgi:hypothetical protein
MCNDEIDVCRVGIDAGLSKGEPLTDSELMLLELDDGSESFRSTESCLECGFDGSDMEGFFGVFVPVPI